MTMAHFTCATFADHLAEHLERDDIPAVRAAMESHAGSCVECGALLTELGAIREAAASLPQLHPERDLWAGIEARIETRVVPITAGSASNAATPSRRHRTWMRPALAAAALVAITAGVTNVATRRAMREPVQGVTPATQVTVVAAAPVADPVVTAPIASPIDAALAAPGGPAARTAASTPAFAPAPETPRARDVQPAARAVFAEHRAGEMAPLDSVYSREILRLRSIVSDRRTGLDSTTVQVLDRNLAVIDRAIRECRAALARDPASHYLNEQLNQALESKIELLRSAATMPVGS